jgi:hydrogenase nickel incorporation protein HypA/HybF
MHELSIAQNIISIVQEHLNEEQMFSVKYVRVKVGKLSNILTDSLIFGFDALTKDTNLDGVTLEVEHIPLTIECKNCGKSTSLENYIFQCPSCRGTSISVVSGNELMVSEIELDD